MAVLRMPKPGTADLQPEESGEGAGKDPTAYPSDVTLLAVCTSGFTQQRTDFPFGQFAPRTNYRKKKNTSKCLQRPAGHECDTGPVFLGAPKCLPPLPPYTQDSNWIPHR